LQQGSVVQQRRKAVLRIAGLLCSIVSYKAAELCSCVTSGLVQCVMQRQLLMVHISGAPDS
jgi:hypothetical protein